jgi:anti-sigma regulatory factor (Ser/Thr protein kinase)
MGKGVPAALLGAALKSHFLRALSQLISLLDRGKLPEPEELVRLVHANVTREFIGLEFFATLCYARFDPPRARVDFVDCGHTKTIHLRQRTGEIEMLAGENTPLGVDEREVYQQVSAPFEAGDLFFFYSDGLTEAQNAAGEFFGEERLVDLIRQNGGLEPQALIQKLHAAVVDFSHSESLKDDLTCVAVRIADDQDERPVTHDEMDVPGDLTHLGTVRAFVRRFCREVLSPALSEEGTDQLELAVAEATSNIIRHAYHGRSDRRVQFTADAFGDRVVLQICHEGEAFDPATVRAPAFDGSREGGFGIYIMAQSVDEVRYFRDESGRNCVRLVKQRIPRKKER